MDHHEELWLEGVRSHHWLSAGLYAVWVQLGCAALALALCMRVIQTLWYGGRHHPKAPMPLFVRQNKAIVLHASRHLCTGRTSLLYRMLTALPQAEGSNAHCVWVVGVQPRVPMQSMYCLMVITGLGGLMYAHQQSWGAQASVFLLACTSGTALQWFFLTLQ